jgi:hypothetical protein
MGATAPSSLVRKGFTLHRYVESKLGHVDVLVTVLIADMSFTEVPRRLSGIGVDDLDGI